MMSSRSNGYAQANILWRRGQSQQRCSLDFFVIGQTSGRVLFCHVDPPKKLQRSLLLHCALSCPQEMYAKVRDTS